MEPFRPRTGPNRKEKNPDGRPDFDVDPTSGQRLPLRAGTGRSGRGRGGPDATTGGAGVRGGDDRLRREGDALPPNVSDCLEPAGARDRAGAGRAADAAPAQRHPGERLSPTDGPAFGRRGELPHPAADWGTGHQRGYCADVPYRAGAVGGAEADRPHPGTGRGGVRHRTGSVPTVPHPAGRRSAGYC